MTDILLVCLAFVAGFLSSLGGGGGGVIILPALLLTGMSPLTAIGTNKLSSLGVMAGSLSEYKKTKLIQSKHLPVLILIAILTSIIGPQLSFSLDDELVKTVIGFVLVISSALLVISRRHKLGLAARRTSRSQQRAGLSIITGVSVVQSAVGAGIGVVNSILYMRFLGYTGLESAATRRLVSLVGLLVTLVSFFLAGYVNAGLGLAMAVTALVGSKLGTRVAIAKGNNFVVLALAITTGLMGLYMIWYQ